jgi:CRISPR-associated protein Cst2
MTKRESKTESNKNLFATVLTYAAPSSNYRGESEENRTVLQKITRRGHEYPVISPEAMRNALREILTGYELPMNRKRLHNEKQLAVEMKDFPDANKFADDFLFGFLVSKDQDKVPKGCPYKRDSVLRMNLAVALSPYRFDALLHQSPLNAGDSPWKNADSSALIHREIVDTAFQYPFALCLADCITGDGPKWARALLKAISELNNVAGGHARAYYEMAPRSIVVRLTPSLVAGFDTYGFDIEGMFRELDRVGKEDDFSDGTEFWVGGEIVRKMPLNERERLAGAQVHLCENPQKLIEALSIEALGPAT